MSLACSHTIRDLNASLLGPKRTKIHRIHRGFTSQESPMLCYKWYGKRAYLKNSKIVTSRRNVSEKNHWWTFIELIIALKTREETKILWPLLLKDVKYTVGENLENKNEKREGQKATEIILYRERNPDSITVFIFLLIKVEF